MTIFFYLAINKPFIIAIMKTIGSSPVQSEIINKNILNNFNALFYFVLISLLHYIQTSNLYSNQKQKFCSLSPHSTKTECIPSSPRQILHSKHTGKIIYKQYLFKTLAVTNAVA